MDKLKIFKPDVLKNWEKQGRTEYLNIVGKVIKQEKDSPSLSSNKKTARCIYELVSNGVKEILKVEQVVLSLSDIIALHKDIPSIVLDILSILDSETLCNDSNEERQNFCNLVKEIEKFIPEKLLKERLEIDTLQDVGTLKNKSFYTKFIRIKTKLYYKQKKFNLLREESEGYAKLITELNQTQTKSFTSTNLLQAIKSLIGCFNLDPNRVLDIILESFELKPRQANVFIDLLVKFTDEPKILSEVLGFKFSNHHNNDEFPTPNSLYVVTSHLLQHGVIDLDDIYPWLMPHDRLIKKEWDKEMEDTKEYVRRLNVLSTKTKDEQDVEKESLQEKFAANQKFGLCEALLSIGAWSIAEELCKRLPQFCVTEQPPVATALCNLLHITIEPLYIKSCVVSEKVRKNKLKMEKNEFYPVPVQNFIDLRTNVIPMLLTLGPSLHIDPVLMFKIIRLCKVALENISTRDSSEPLMSDETLYKDVTVLLDCVLLPALSYMDCNCGIAEEIWNVIKFYPYQIRYCLYSRWKNETPKDHAKLLKKNADAEKNIKNIMKRVSKENVKPIGRLIGKLTHASPGVLFDYVLIQIQMYDNLIGPVVDSLKFLTTLSYDVLGYCLIETLANTSVDKDRFKYDGTSISVWLQSLSSFCGAAFKKYNVELTGLLQYVANQLKSQKSLDLLILSEVVLKMAGIEAAEELTSDQLDAMFGGDLLKVEAGYLSQVRNTKKSSTRLKEALCEHDLGVSLCLLMAQQRYNVVYRETEQTHLKLVGKLYDQCQDTLVQFGTFLGSTLSVEEYDARFPPIHAMLSDYHISADVAFFLARPKLNHAINIKYDSLRKADPNYKKLSVASKHQKYCEAVREVMAPLIESVGPLHSAKVWDDMTPQFLVTFWSLTMYDLHVPVDTYQKEINKIKTQSLHIMDSKDMTSSKGKKEQERCNALIEKLQEERKKQQEHVEKVLARLKTEKDNWFGFRTVRSAKNETIMQFLQLCVFPRCIFTAVDANYCAKFISTIHSLKTPNFSTLLCIDRLFCDITYSVTLCTENEASRYGRFLCAMLDIVMKWHSDISVFNKECSNHPGFVTKYKVSNQFSDAIDQVSYENYRHVCHKWHYKITKAMMVCLESKDYTQIRNSLIILIKILPHYPVIPKLAQIIEKRIEKVQQEEKSQRQDLYTLALSYAGHLKAKAPSMIRESEFHQVVTKKKDVTEADKKTDVGVSGGGKKEKAVTSGKTVAADVKTESSRSSAKREIVDAKGETTPRSSSRERSEKHKDEGVKEEKKSRERKEEKHGGLKEERSYREERYAEAIPLSKDEQRFCGREGYYTGSGHFYDDTRELSSLSNSSSGSHKHSQDLIVVDPDRDVKRRKLDGSSKSRKEEVWVEPADVSGGGGGDKKERAGTTSSSRSKLKISRDKSERKERKVGRKRDRVNEEDLSSGDGIKLRKDEEKLKSNHQNGGSEMMETSHREKRHYTREKSPSGYDNRERSHDRVESSRSLRGSERLDRVSPRDKHSRRSETSKRR